MAKPEKPEKPEASTEVEATAAADYDGLTEAAKVATIRERDETIRRLQAGQATMEENRDHWMARAERAEAAIRRVVETGEACLDDLLANRG